jgi:hypothetical protein
MKLFDKLSPLIIFVIALGLIIYANLEETRIEHMRGYNDDGRIGLIWDRDAYGQSMAHQIRRGRVTAGWLDKTQEAQAGGEGTHEANFGV